MFRCLIIFVSFAIVYGLNKTNRYVNKPDHWNRNPFLFQTYNEPQEYYLLPTISNGFLGTVVNNDSIYMNGLYNGLAERSHRVRIPAITSVYSYVPSTDIEPTYTLDCRRGLYIKELSTDSLRLTHYTYIHRRYKNLYVNEFKIERLANTDVTVNLENVTQLIHDYFTSNDPNLNPNGYSYYMFNQNPGKLRFEQQVIKEPTKIQFYEMPDGIYYLKAVLDEPEMIEKRKKEVHIFYTNIPKFLHVFKNTTIKKFFLIASIDRDRFKAQSAYEDALRTIQINQDTLLSSHISGWEELWQKSGFAMVQGGNFDSTNQESFKIAQRLYSSFYNLYSALPFEYSSNAENQFYGLSPSGLSYGALRKEYYNSTVSNYLINKHYSEGYGGHIMYNQDFWILPLISMFNRDMAKSIIQSRVRSSIDHMSIWEQAKKNALDEGAEGLRYPWEQGDYGQDLSSMMDMRKKKILVTGAVSFGTRAYIRMSHDKDFLVNDIAASLKGEDFVGELAKYWNSKLTYNTGNQLFELNNVLFGELNQKEVNNEAFTNTLAKIALNSYKYALRIADKDPFSAAYSYRVNEYDHKAGKIHIPYDGSRKLFLEYDGFNPQNQINYETYVPFLNYPLMAYMSYAEKKSLLDRYSMQIGNDGKNLMTYSALAITSIEINEGGKARDFFGKIGTHFNGPFHVISEYLHYANSFNQMNNFNFLPGYASYIHTFIAGFSGIRVNDFQIDIVYPTREFGSYETSSTQFINSLPFFSPHETLNEWNITGVSYRGFELDFMFNLNRKTLQIRNTRVSDGYSNFNNKVLDIIIYENTKSEIKQFRVGELVTINLNQDSWSVRRNTQKKTKNVTPRNLNLQTNNYADNIHILASIYPSHYYEFIHMASKSYQIKTSLLYLSLLSSLIFMYTK